MPARTTSSSWNHPLDDQDGPALSALAVNPIRVAHHPPNSADQPRPARNKRRLTIRCHQHAHPPHRDSRAGGSRTSRSSYETTQRDGRVASRRRTGRRRAGARSRLLSSGWPCWLAWLSVLTLTSRSCPITWSICLLSSPGRQGRVCSCRTAVTSIGDRKPSVGSRAGDPDLRVVRVISSRSGRRADRRLSRGRRATAAVASFRRGRSPAQCTTSPPPASTPSRRPTTPLRPGKISDIARAAFLHPFRIRLRQIEIAEITSLI
jgi:hypothetical protein